MNLPGFSLRRPVTTLMLALSVLIFGIVSFSKLPLDLYPSIEIPYVIVVTNYQGVGPQEIETLLSRPIEEAVGSVNSIKNVSSRSSEGQSIVICEFTYGTDMDFAALNMREKIDLVKGALPDGASAPMVMALDPDSMPVYMLSLSGSEDLAEMQTFAEDKLKPQLERLDGVASVTIEGGYSNKVEIAANQTALDGYSITVDYISQIIGAENLALPSGEVQNGNQKLSIRTTGKFSSIDDIKNALIPLPSGGNVRLSEIADVTLAHDDLTSIATYNGKPAISLNVQKQSGTNTVEVSGNVAKTLDEIIAKNERYEVDTIFNQADYINQAINAVVTNALLGAILAILVLYFFLHNWRATIIIGIAIPASIIVTLTSLYFLDVTLNMMTLGGLALGVGMMVDNSIVVLENIYRFRQEGHGPFDAALKGASEVALAITASTITTIAVFLPIVFVEGITSSLFKELALTVTMSLLSSLIVALTIVPLMCNRLLPESLDFTSRNVFSRMEKGFFSRIDKGAGKMLSGYKRLLRGAMRHRVITILAAVSVFVLSILSLFTVGTEFFPASDQGTVSVSVSLPRGSDLSETEAAVDDVISRIKDIPEIKSLYSLAGASSVAAGAVADTASVSLNLVPESERERSSAEVAEDVRARLKDIAGIETSITAGDSDMSAMAGAAISVMIKGDDLDELTRISNDIVSIIEGVPGATEVSSDMQEGYPEVEIRVNRENAAHFGLTAAQIASAVRNSVSGATATRLTYQGSEIDVIVKGSDLSAKSLENLKNIQITTASGGMIPIELVADVDISLGPSMIVRENQVRTVTVSGQVINRDVGSVNTDIEKAISAYRLPDGYSIEMGGQTKEIQSAFSDLGLALILAIALIYIVLASQFESILLPISIMLAVPLGLSGGMLGLFVTRTPISVVAFIGMIMLCGVVVNNAIVLVDYIKTRRNAGEDRLSAILAAGPIRIRPVLMTTLTTVLALIPMALGMGDGGELEAPLAITFIGGLSLATVLTLVVIPVLYSLIDDLTARLGRGFRRKKKTQSDIPGAGTENQDEAREAEGVHQ